MILLPLILTIGVLLLCSCVREKDEVSIELVMSQKEGVLTFFNSNRGKLQHIKQRLDDESFNISYIAADDAGYITLDNSEKIWLDDISTEIKEVFAAGQENMICSIQCSSDENYDYYVEFYFPDSMVVMRLIYSEQDLTTISSWYEVIDVNWFLWVAGMT